ncbi:MAG: SDR family NAD(P)-dependent oxidoreductase [Acidobacteria bacterium]|nr:SDR family NAD(P)-dependent oxidoreductase [Acidobacteriota bacterium]
MKSLKKLMGLEGRVALVTGGGGHIGAAICDALAELGATIAVIDVVQESCNSVAKHIHNRYGLETLPLVVDLTGSGTGSDIETACLLVYYADLPGIDSRLLRVEEVMPRIRHIVTVENTLALGTAGGYSGEEAIDAEFDLLRANTDYAILGYLVDVECACIRYRGPFSGNLGIGGPGADTKRELTRDWFVRLSMDYDLPLIPVFNAADKSNVLIDGAQDENGADVTVTTLLAQLDT